MLLFSLVLQKRRERINERLKILQNLVPNGTKVDISTMLEEAVHYVKFLQLQIRVRICVQNLIPSHLSAASSTHPANSYMFL